MITIAYNMMSYKYIDSLKRYVVTNGSIRQNKNPVKFTLTVQNITKDSDTFKIQTLIIKFLIIKKLKINNLFNFKLLYVYVRNTFIFKYFKIFICSMRLDRPQKTFNLLINNKIFYSLIK